MPINLYDETLAELDQTQPAAPPAPRPNLYAETLREQDDSRTQGVRRSLLQVDAIPPDEQAEADRLAALLNLPVDVVRRNLPAMRRRAQTVETDYAAIVRETPRLAAWLEEAGNAAAAQDDLPQLGFLEWLTTAPARAVGRGQTQVALARLRAATLFRAPTADETARIAALKAELATDTPESSWWRGAVTGAAEQLPIIAGSLEQGIRRGAPFAVTAGSAAALAGPASPVTVPAAFGGGLGAGVLTGAAEFAFTLEAGLAYDEYLDVHDETGQSIDPAVARGAAIATGAVNAGLEAVGLGVLLRTIPGVSTLTRGATRTAVRAALRQPTIRRAIGAAVGRYAGALTAETSVEVAQEVTTILSGELAKAASGVETDLATPAGRERIGTRIAETAADAVQAMALLVLPGPTLGATIDVAHARAARAQQAFFEALGEGAVASQTVARVPGRAQALLAAATQDGPVERLYVPTESWTSYWQELGVDPDAVATEITGDAQALARAVADGHDLALPTAAYAVTLARTEHNQYFAHEMRVAPTVMNAREADAFLAATEAQLAEEAVPDLSERLAAIRTQSAEAIQPLLDAPVPPQFAELPASERREVRRILAELRVSGVHLEDEQAEGSNLLRNVPNAPVFQELTRDTRRTGPQLRRSLARWIGGRGQAPAVVAAAVRVARIRAYQDPDAFRAMLPPEAGIVAGEVYPGAVASRGDVTPVIADVQAQLEAAGIDRSIAEAYATLYGEAFGTLGVRAGVDPVALFRRYGLTVTRPDLAPRATARETTLAQADVDRIASLPPIGTAGAVGVPHAVDLRTAIRVPSARELQQHGQVEAVTIADLVGTQDRVDPDHIRGLVAGRATQRPGSAARPIAVRREDGRLFLIDGQHRVVAAWAAGETTIDAIVVPEAPLQGRPVTLFQPADEQALFAGGDGGKRGVIRFGPDRQFAIELLAKANLSTFLHETGHFYLEVLGDLAADLTVDDAQLTDTQRQVRADFETLLRTFGLERREEITREHHEQFARLFEAFLLEGKAPSVELRGVFARFRSWLLAIYRTIRGLHVELTDEVRAVMGRLLATDDAIAAAEAEAGVVPLFADRATAGMSESAWETYRATLQSASDRARDELQQRLIREWTRAQQAWWQTERDARQAAIEPEVFAEPVYRAFAAIRRGTAPDGTPLVADQVAEPMRLSKAILVERYGARILADLPFLFAADGVSPDLVADLFGFASGDLLVEALRTAEPMREKIDRLVDDAMRTEFGDLLLDGTLPEAAMEAVGAGEARQAVVQAELAALTREMAAGVIPPAGAIQTMAAQRIAALEVRQVKPGQYLVAAQRAAGRAFEALATATDRGAAIAAKQQELVNLALYREAVRVRDTVDADVRWVRAHATAAARQRIGLAGEDYLQQWDGFLERYGFKPVTLRRLAQRESLRQWVTQRQAEGLPVDVPDEVLEETRERHYREMTVDEFTGVVDAMRQLVHLTQLKNRLLRADEQRDLDTLAADLAASVRDFAPARPVTTLESSLPQDQLRLSAAAGFAWMRKFASFVRQMDGGRDGGPLWEALVRPLNAAADREAVMRQGAAEALAALFDGFDTADLAALTTRRHLPAIGMSISRAGRILVALNWGNEGNRQRLTSGFGWSTEQVAAVLDTLDEKDWRFVQGVWAHLQGYWADIAAKQSRVYGVPPIQVEPIPFETRFGTMPGGYFPIKFDPQRDPKAYQESVEELAAEMMRGGWTLQTTRRGHTKARLETVIGRRLWLDFGVIWQHVDQVVHDLTQHEMLIDATRLLRHPAVKTAIADTYGTAVYRELTATLTDVAAGSIPARHQGDRVLSWLLNGTSIARMGWNFMTSAVQPLGLTVSVERVGARWVARGAAAWLGGAVRMDGTVRRIHDESPFMRLRHTTFMREINDVRNRIQPRGSWALAALGGKVAGRPGAVAGQVVSTWHGVLEETYFWFISRAQMIADVPTWLGAEAKALAEGNPADRAIALADQAVIDSQGSGHIKDLAHVQRGAPAFKVWTQFFSYFSVVHNRGAEALGRRRQGTDPISRGRLAVDLLVLYTVPMLLERAIRDALTDRDDDDEWLTWFLRNQAAYLAATFPFAREVAGAIEGYQYSGPAGAGFFSEAARLTVQASQLEWDEPTLRALNATAGILFHYPATHVERMVRAAIALEEDGAGAAWQALFGGRPD